MSKTAIIQTRPLHSIRQGSLQSRKPLCIDLPALLKEGHFVSIIFYIHLHPLRQNPPVEEGFCKPLHCISIHTLHKGRILPIYFPTAHIFSL